MVFDELTKPCNQCEKEKPLEEFYGRASSPDGKSPICKECESANHKAYYKKNKSKKIHRRSKLKNNYRMTEADYDKMFEEQKGACAICKESGRKLVIDHDHATGRVRKLLCNACNHGLGRFRDSIPIMQRAVAYLEEHLDPPDTIESDNPVASTN